MIEINIDGMKISISSFIYHLFSYGDESPLIKTLKEYICNDDYMDEISKFLKDVIDYFYTSTHAMIDFIELTASPVHSENETIRTILHFKDDGGDMLKMMQEYDENTWMLYKDKNRTVPLYVYPIINSALSSYILGLMFNANSLICSGVFLMIRHYFDDHLLMHLHERLVDFAVSDHQRKKARKPRNPYYNEVMQVIQLTWKKYPKASPTGLRRKLFLHYHEHVCENTLGRWIKDSGLQPPKPDKYSSFELVHPQ